MPAKTKKLSDKEQVELYMEKLDYPLKDTVEALREIIMASSETLKERIKWNAPSYYSDVDLLTMNLRSTDNVMIVFHHIGIVQIQSPELKGEYKDRRLMYFNSVGDVEQKTALLQQIIREYVMIAQNIMNKD